jgi:hypothetical protein
MYCFWFKDTDLNTQLSERGIVVVGGIPGFGVGELVVVGQLRFQMIY